MNKYAKRLAISILITFVCLTVLEMAMIILEPWVFKGFYQYDSDLGFRVRPYANSTNRFGFNDEDYPLQKPDNTIRILVLGDSFNWAGGRDKNYAAVLKKTFQHENVTPPVEVINAGYPMMSTPQELMILKKYGLEYQPDVVVLGFFAGNDFTDGDPDIKRIIVNDTYFEIDRRRELTIFGYPVVPTSRLVSFVKQKYVIWKEFNRGEQSSLQVDTGKKDGTFGRERFLEIERDRLKFCNLDLHRLGTFDRHVKLIFDSLSAMQDLLEARKIKLLVAIYPDEFQVDEGLLNRVLERYGLSGEDFDVELPQKLLHKFLDSRGIPYVDLLDEFKSQGKNGGLYVPRDTHWNDKGNELAASILFSHLRERVGILN